jgi:hypothetical protein
MGLAVFGSKILGAQSFAGKIWRLNDLCLLLASLVYRFRLDHDGLIASWAQG